MNCPTAPLSYAVEITYQCNNFCSGCANVWEPYRSQTLPNWKELFDCIAPPQNRKQYAELIRITGGEPTLHNDFIGIIEYIDTFDIAHALFTNGCWENTDEIIDLYSNCRHFLGMLVSLHGSNEFAHHAFVNRKEAFSEVCQNIKSATQAGIEVFTNTVLTKYSCQQVEDVIKLSQELGAKYAVFNRFLGGEHPLNPTEEQLKKAVRLIEKLQKEGVSCRIGNCIPKCFVQNSSQGANAGIEHCSISPEGWVRPDDITSYTFGNIFEQPIKKIWASEKAEWYRNQVPPACFECAEFLRCRGGDKSLIVEYNLAKDPLMKKPIHEIEQETIHFDPDWKPILHCNLRKESFGYLLTRYNWSIPISFETKPLLDALNGRYTLLELQNRWGEDALSFIGDLYREGCIRFD